MGDSIFWLAVYLLSRVTPLFPAIFFFEGLNGVVAFTVIG